MTTSYHRQRLSIIAAALGLSTALPAAWSQTATTGPATAIPAPEAAEIPATGPAMPRDAARAQPLRTQSLLSIGPVAVVPHPMVSFMHTDGLLSQPGRSGSSYVTRLSAGVRFEYQAWSLDYTPTWTHYSNSAFRKTWEHLLDANGQVVRADWSLAFSEHFTSTETPLIETARQTGLKISATNLTAYYDLGRKLSVELAGNQTLNFVQGLPDWHQWDLVESIHYAAMPSLDLSLGVTEGYVLVYKSADAGFIRPQLQGVWTVTRKVWLTARAGLEERKYLGGSKQWTETPITSVGLTYQPVETTTLTVITDRQVSPSFTQGRTLDARQWDFAVSQRLFQHFRLRVSARDRDVTYLAVPRYGQEARQDRQRGYEARLSTTFFRKGTAAVFYNYNRNRSSSTGYSFVSHQIGGQIGFRF